MSPEEWAKKISDLIKEAEDDLHVNSKDFWMVSTYRGGFFLVHYVDGRESDSTLVIE